MTFAITLLALVVAGVALLRVARLSTGHRAVDLGLAWLVGSGAVAAVAPVLRFALGVPFGRLTLAALVLAPVAAAAARWARSRRDLVPASPPSTAGEAAAVAGRAAPVPRPRWLFAPMALYVAVVTAAVLLHGINTPTQTDDAIRVRAFAPMLAFADGWAADERGVFSMAGPLPTFVPALAWIATGTIDHFHVNYAVLAELVALLVLVVGLGYSRGSPERGWASAFALLSIPLFVYHCTSTYSDAVLAMRVAGGLAFSLDYARTRDRADAARALLLLGFAALVKREGELVAAAPAAVLLSQLAWEGRRGLAFPWRLVALLCAPVVLGAVGKIAAVGLDDAFPMLQLVLRQARVATDAAVRPEGTSAAAAAVFSNAVFRFGNQGMIYWVLAATVVVRWRALRRSGHGWPLLAVAALGVEVAVSSIFVVPEFTLDQSTVHRALLVVSVPAALWLAAVVVDGATDPGDSAPAARAQARRRGRR